MLWGSYYNYMNYTRKTTQSIELKPAGIDLIIKTIYFYRVPILIFLLSLLITFPYRDGIQVYSYPKAGQVSKETIIAPLTFDVLKSQREIDDERSVIEGRVLPIFVKDTSPQKKTNATLKNISRLLATIKDTTVDDTLRQKNITELKTHFSKEEITALSNTPGLIKKYREFVYAKSSIGILSRVIVPSYPELEALRKEYGEDFPFLMSKTQFIHQIDNGDSVNISIDSIYSIPHLFREAVKQLDLGKSGDDIQRCYSALYHLTKTVVTPTLNYNSDATSEKRREAVAGIKRIKKSVIQDLEIVRKHQSVTPEIAEILTSLEKVLSTQNKTAKQAMLIFSTIVTILLILGVSTLLAFYLVKFIPRNIDKRGYFRAMAVMAGVELLIIRLGLLFLSFTYGDSIDTHLALQYSAVPMTIATILASILFNRNSGLMLSIFFSIYIGVVTDFDLIASIGTLITGGTAAYIADNVRYRKDFLKLVSWMMFVNSLAITMTVIAVQEITFSNLVQALLFANFDAIVSVLMVSLLLPLFEQLFNLTTDMTLMELADMNHPLLKQLSILAPGTYNHSIQVANLAESAADKVGADPLLCRVASYYHDIGKMKKPTHFIENQRFKKNIHDKVSPAMSVRMISAHVRDGLELADKYRLPKPVKDAIVQHHGDSFIGYFYHKANDAKSDNESVDKRDFCYGGPKPQSKENAIIMVADSVEAISRTMKSSGTGELREMVRKVVYNKISDMQFDECDLTFNEANSMINGFMPVLEGIFHTRIEYPEQEEEDSE